MEKTNKLMTKKLTKEEKEAYRIVQSIRGKASAKKAGKKGMSERGKKGVKARMATLRKRKKLSTGRAK